MGQQPTFYLNFLNRRLCSWQPSQFGQNRTSAERKPRHEGGVCYGLHFLPLTRALSLPQLLLFQLANPLAPFFVRQQLEITRLRHSTEQESISQVMELRVRIAADSGGRTNG